MKGDFTLASGRRSKYYFDSKKLTLHPTGAYVVASQVTRKLRDERIRYIGGTAYGAIPIVAAVAVYSELSPGPSVEAFYHRKEAKLETASSDIQGNVPPLGERVAIVEDVVTTGDSLLHAIELAKRIGCEVTDAIVLVDRDEGGRETIEMEGYNFWSLFTVKSHGNSSVELVFNGWNPDSLKLETDEQIIGAKGEYDSHSQDMALHPRTSLLVASELTKLLHQEGIGVIGGTAYDAIPIVAAIAVYSELSGGPRIEGFYHRKEAKGHGTEADAEGRIPQVGERVAILEDVFTTADSLLEVIHLAEGLGCKVTDTVALVDRSEGGRRVIEDRGYNFWSLWTDRN